MKRLFVELWLLKMRITDFFKGRLKNAPTFEASKDNVWNRTYIKGNTLCSDGSKYHLLTKANHTSKKLLVYFSGGGANWDEKSARYALNPENLIKGRGKYFENIPPYKMSLMHGMMDERIADNPYNDFNIVYVPYTTGDFHIGDNQVSYTPTDGKPFTVRHNGKNNVEAAIAFIKETFDDIETLVIGGESAGGFGAAFWGPKILDLYPESKSTVFADCSYLVSKKWPDVIKNNWGLDFKAQFGYDIGPNIIVDAMTHLCEHYPNTKVLQVVSLRDKILMEFETEINEVDNDKTYQDAWSSSMQETIKGLAATHSNYHYYFTNFDLDENETTRHTFTTWPEYYKVKESEVLLHDWMIQSFEYRRDDSVAQTTI